MIRAPRRARAGRRTVDCDGIRPSGSGLGSPGADRGIQPGGNAGELHPHEPAAGLLGLLHGASPGELRCLRPGDLDLPAATIRLGRRPQPTPLDPATATALRRCLDHHDRRIREKEG